MAMKTTNELKIGGKAPAFDLPDEKGNRHTLQGYEGKTVVLYFYPKDDTPGCTKESCEFRDIQADFKKKDAVILGVSPDGPAFHQKFIGKFNLNFPLLADEKQELCNAYGVWKLKKFMGKEYMGVERSTFLISKDGKIAKAWRKVKVNGHGEQVAQALKELKNK